MAIKEQGVYQLTGDPSLMEKMDILLESFVAQYRMKLPGSAYQPCYKILKNDQ